MDYIIHIMDIIRKNRYRSPFLDVKERLEVIPGGIRLCEIN